MENEEVYLTALKHPVMIWNHSLVGKAKVINPQIDLNDFQIEFDNIGSRSLMVHIETPRLKMYSVNCADEETNAKDLQFLTDLYTNPAVIEKYGSGTPWTVEAAHNRFYQFSTNWKEHNSPFSGFMCYRGDEQVGSFNLGNSEIPGVAEFAAISALPYWKKGFASEIGLLLYKYPKMVKEKGFRMSDGSELMAVTATARPDNGSAIVMERLGLTCTGAEVKYGANRKYFFDTIDQLDTVVKNTEFRGLLGHRL